MKENYQLTHPAALSDCITAVFNRKTLYWLVALCLKWQYSCPYLTVRVRHIFLLMAKQIKNYGDAVLFGELFTTFRRFIVS